MSAEVCALALTLVYPDYGSLSPSYPRFLQFGRGVLVVPSRCTLVLFGIFGFLGLISRPKLRLRMSLALPQWALIPLMVFKTAWLCVPFPAVCWVWWMLFCRPGALVVSLTALFFPSSFVESLSITDYVWLSQTTSTVIAVSARSGRDVLPLISLILTVIYTRPRIRLLRVAYIPPFCLLDVFALDAFFFRRCALPSLLYTSFTDLYIEYRVHNIVNTSTAVIVKLLVI